jgi:hypothetical protein
MKFHSSHSARSAVASDAVWLFPGLVGVFACHCLFPRARSVALVSAALLPPFRFPLVARSRRSTETALAANVGFAA